VSSVTGIVPPRPGLAGVRLGGTARGGLGMGLPQMFGLPGMAPGAVAPLPENQTSPLLRTAARGSTSAAPKSW
jgi:hypothetical protein